MRFHVPSFLRLCTLYHDAVNSRTVCFFPSIRTVVPIWAAVPVDGSNSKDAIIKKYIIFVLFVKDYFIGQPSRYRQP